MEYKDDIKKNSVEILELKNTNNQNKKFSWINNKVLLYSTGNYIHYPEIKQ